VSQGARTPPVGWAARTRTCAHYAVARAQRGL